ncbi:hypothetical protein BLNAU_483 [Blattamonas nauphoetae]|uniref:Uncharacterized protein n=1 Tax=Blattamonas nauphoetae TaxID=2049346 RepID=A0ABQ9X2B7_9EUKA|nr:hypothetical protein BLNAU_19136 [Blattamonas nauphoetae]KAK2964566.1 hypothetical protein BLNAU_483 [Blattamonas nauphoetae]
MLDHTRALIHAGDSVVPPGEEAKNATKVAEKMSSPPQNVVNPKPLSATKQVMVEAIVFSNKVEVKRVNKADTLYRRLHGSKQKDMHRRLVDSAEMGKMLT